MESVANFSICYLFKGRTSLAAKKIAKFAQEMQNKPSISQTLEKFYKTSRVVELKDIPSLEPLISEIFTQRKEPI